jgi:hypothetical protein
VLAIFDPGTGIVDIVEEICQLQQMRFFEHLHSHRQEAGIKATLFIRLPERATAWKWGDLEIGGQEEAQKPVHDTLVSMAQICAHRPRFTDTRVDNRRAMLSADYGCREGEISENHTFTPAA